MPDDGRVDTIASADIDPKSDDNIILNEHQTKLGFNIAMATEIVRRNPGQMRVKRRQELIDLLDGFDKELEGFLRQLEIKDNVGIWSIICAK